MATKVKERIDLAARTVLPPTDPTATSAIQTLLEDPAGQARLVAPNGDTIDLPSQVHEVLKDVALAMANGLAVTVAPISMRLTTSQAAEILGISRPTLVRLLQDGVIPFEQPRRHRILRLDDVLAYQADVSTRRGALLTEMTRQAHRDGLYDARAADYTSALDEARRAEDL